MMIREKLCRYSVQMQGVCGGMGIFNAQLTESSDVKPAGMQHKVVLWNRALQKQILLYLV